MRRTTREFPDTDLHVEGWTVPRGVSAQHTRSTHNTLLFKLT